MAYINGKEILFSPEIEVTIEGVEPTLIEKEITANGTYPASDDGADGFSKVIVNVPIETPTTEEKTVTPTTSAQEITPTNADYLSKVTVNAIPSEYVIPSGSVTITENGTHSVSGKASVVVNVPDSPLPIEVATEDEMTALLSTAEVGSIYKYTGTSGTYENGAIYIVEEE